ncbi:MAG: cell division protein ZapD [Betaproteobacteria bacterium]|nr:MAG: cell division protein ZapD [Betaproteobacteria bacterium]
MSNNVIDLHSPPAASGASSFDGTSAEGTSTLLTFETPLSERSRTWLRLEEVFLRTHTYAARRDAVDHRAALVSLFDIVDAATRTDLKTDLLAELERQRAVWSAQLDNPDVAVEALREFLSDMDAVIHDLHGQIGKIGQHLRDSEWLQSVRQRSTSPGGACGFELPMLHSWLQRSDYERKAELKAWLDPFSPLEEAVLLVLRLLRESARGTDEIARQGNFHRTLASQRPPLLAHISVDPRHGVVPEVSANKYTVNVRFLEHRDQFQSGARAALTTRDVRFRLSLCAL